MKDEYVIINKTAIQKRIEELEEIDGVICSHLIRELNQTLSKSTPLIPEIEKAFDAGTDWQEGGTILYPDKHGYTSNLKLNI